MRHLIFSFLLLSLSAFMSAQNNLSALMPMPNHYALHNGPNVNILTSSTVYYNDTSLKFAASELSRICAQRMGVQPQLTVSKANATVWLVIDSSIRNKQEYSLTVGKKLIIIKGATPGAVLYGVMTFDQILLGDCPNTFKHQVAPIDIVDKPRFERRALMLDPARNFLPVKDIKFYMDKMIKYKYNVLQLHLTDDQGWRIEIQGRPELTAHQSFYTQAELKDLVAYAAERNIELIPELDIPGHTVSVLAAYPHLGCTSTDTIPKILGKTTNMMLCASVEGVYDLYKDIITQVSKVFTSPYIHLGGDEAVIDTNWGTCARCRQLMNEKGYTKASQLMIPFFDRMLGFVRQAGKKAILWCELDNIRMPAHDYLFPYPKDVVLVTWRNGLTPLCMELSRNYGNELLMAPGEYTYLDYPQLKGDLPEYNNWGMPVTTLAQSYEFDPGYGMPADKQKNLWGIMGTLWGEAIRDINRACYMTYPRAFALAEAGWTEMSHRNWKSFKERLYPNLLNLIKEGVSVRAPYEITQR